MIEHIICIPSTGMTCENNIKSHKNHASPGSNQMNQNVEPKTFFHEVKCIYNVEIRGCLMLMIKSIQNRIF